MPVQFPVWKKNTTRAFGLALGIATVVSICTLRVSKADLSDALRSQSAGAVAIATGLFIANLLVNAWAYRQLLVACGTAVPTGASLSAYGTSVLAKYVPGSVWQIAGRAVSFGTLGVRASEIVWTSLVEQCISLGLCLSTGWILRFPDQWPLPAILIILGIVAIFKVGASVRGLFGLSYVKLDRGRLLLSIALYFVGISVFASAYWLLLPGFDPLRAPSFIGSLLLGTTAGLAAIFVPGGLGVREAAVLALTSELRSADVVAALLTARVISLIAEVVVTIVCIGLTPRTRAA